MKENADISTALRFKCGECGKLTAGRMPRGGDGSGRYARKHRRTDGAYCRGSFGAAEWVTVRRDGDRIVEVANSGV